MRPRCSGGIVSLTGLSIVKSVVLLAGDKLGIVFVVPWNEGVDIYCMFICQLGLIVKTHVSCR